MQIAKLVLYGAKKYFMVTNSGRLKDFVMDSTTLNYTNVCWYCGVIYKSNRRTSKYCCKKHNSLYSQYGPRIFPSFNESGIVVNYDLTLEEIFQEDVRKDMRFEAPGYLLRTIREEFEYKGPLPSGNEILVVGSYVIKRNNKVSKNEHDIFYVKPFTQLTDVERMCSVIVASTS